MTYLAGTCFYIINSGKWGGEQFYLVPLITARFASFTEVYRSLKKLLEHLPLPSHYVQKYWMQNFIVQAVHTVETWPCRVVQIAVSRLRSFITESNRLLFGSTCDISGLMTRCLKFSYKNMNVQSERIFMKLDQALRLVMQEMKQFHYFMMFIYTVSWYVQ